MSTKTNEPVEVRNRLGKIEDFVKVSKGAFDAPGTVVKIERAKVTFKDEPVAMVAKIIQIAAQANEVIDDHVKQMLEVASTAVRQINAGVAVNNGRLEVLNDMNILGIVPMEFESDINNTSPYCPTPKKQAPQALQGFF